MKVLLIEPVDVLFFRDAVPMSAGQGKGSGCRLPCPTSFHEALRSTLLLMDNEQIPDNKKVQGRPRNAPRRGNWHAAGHDGQTFIATRAFRSLRTIGPFPSKPNTGLLLPVPLDAVRHENSIARAELLRLPDVPANQTPSNPSDYKAPCVPVAVTPPAKSNQLSGWWTCEQYRAYLGYSDTRHTTQHSSEDFFRPVPTSALWSAEHRIGVEIDPGSAASKEHQLYAATFLRPDTDTRFVAWVDLASTPSVTEEETKTRRKELELLSTIKWLLLGGEFRLARLRHLDGNDPPLPDPIESLRTPPSPTITNGPCLLKWILVTPGFFVHGSLPGWCVDTATDSTGNKKPVGRVCLSGLPGRAHLISWCIGKPRAVSGWDILDAQPKPTLLVVPEGSVYYFLCENGQTAEALATKLHWQPRSDFYGEKGCGYGLVSFEVRMHDTSPTIDTLAREVFA
ncbi:MAG: hypothetical protein N3G20_08450 [Verrucomicrobiae bacterium]|nr:hypothetical protein [Verrucomicrobiae bacterium]